MFKKIYLSLLTVLIFASTSGAQPICPLDGSGIPPKEVESLEQLKRMATLQDGRVKPFETYAQTLLLRFSGKKRYEGEDAVHWVTRFFFAPQQTKDDRVFLINHPDIPEALGIEPVKDRRYSFAQIEPVFDRLNQLAMTAQQIDPKERDIVENELIRVHENVKLYSILSVSYSFVFPHPDFTITNPDTIKELGLPENMTQFSFINIALKAQELHNITAPLQFKSMDQLTERELEIIQVVANLSQWSTIYRHLPFTNIISYHPEDISWLSPWDAIDAGLSTPEGRLEILLLSDIVVSYWNGQQLDFDLAVKTFNESVHKRTLSKNITEINRFDLEILFNHLRLFFWAKILFLTAFVLSLYSFAKQLKPIYRTTVFLILIGFAGNLIGIIMRMMILQRPPVSNLYETFIFVSLISVLAGLIIERVQKNNLGNIVASLSGWTFLTIASKFGMEGDTLQVLVAVLNTNFWLATHVTTITIGYAGVCVAGIVGHIYILQAAFGTDKTKLRAIQNILIGTLGFGLTATFLGTNLGGIWADQSWGRFWGWDPKENGALLIVLWCALLFHAKIGKMIGPLGFAAGSVFGIVVVMWAWFGVNLLSVGLHSYGFTSGLAVNLTIYFILQMLFLIIMTPLAKKRL